jgi:hypothetical protein
LLKGKSHACTCKAIEPIQAACIIKYEELKDKCLEPGFIFAKQYPQSLRELQSQHDNRIVSLFWPKPKEAENCIASIRRRRNQTQVVPISAETLIIDDEMKFISVNNEQKLFLQYDNQDTTGNRILVFFSETGAKMMESSNEWHMDGSFKNCPKIFKQLL